MLATAMHAFHHSDTKGLATERPIMEALRQQTSMPLHLRAAPCSRVRSRVQQIIQQHVQRVGPKTLAIIVSRRVGMQGLASAEKTSDMWVG